MLNKIKTIVSRFNSAKSLLLVAFLLIMQFSKAQTIAAFNYAVNGNAVTLTNTSTSASGAHFGYFVMDDGANSYSINSYSAPIIFTYQTAGIYNVCITIVDSSSSVADSICHAINIQTPNPDTIKGIVYADGNNNGIMDMGEVGVANQLVHICKNSCPYVLTDANGNYQFIISSGNYSLALSDYTITTTQPINNYYSFYDTMQGASISGYNFGLPTPTCTNKANFTPYISCKGYVYCNFQTKGQGTYSFDYGDLSPITSSYYHTYSATGIYNILCIYSDTSISCADTFSTTVNINSIMSASFSFAMSGDTAVFTNTSTGTFTNTFWDFDYHSYDTSSYISKQLFLVGGVHWVNLSINNLSNCYDSVYQSININLTNADTISGLVYNDANSSGTLDAGELGLANHPVYMVVNNQNYTTNSDAQGVYKFIVASGHIYTVYSNAISFETITQPLGASALTGTSDAYDVSILGASGVNHSGNNFGFHTPACATIFSSNSSLISGSTYAFTDSITNTDSVNVVTYIYYGDGNVGFNLPSTHTYTSNGTYTPYLIIYSNNYYCQDSIYLAPITVSGLSACAGNAIFTVVSYSCNGYYFYPNNQLSGLQYNWNFGDGTTSNLAYPTHFYANSGTYNITLVTTNTATNCSDSFIQTQIFNSVIVPTASFTYSISSNTVTFTNTSTGSISNYIWNFGDGNYSSLANPTHTFTIGGTHTIYLEVTNSNNCGDSLSQNIFITIPNADTLSGMVFTDNNWNGLFDAGDQVNSNETIYLYDSINFNYRYAQTNLSGNYQFIVAAGTYTISHSQTFGTSYTIPLSPNNYLVHTTSNQNLAGFNFGIVDTVPSISGKVFFDMNGNGVQDAGENGVQYATVMIAGNSGSQHVYTNINGDYTYNCNYGAGFYSVSYSPGYNGYSTYSISTVPNLFNLNTVSFANYSNNNFGIKPSSTTTGDNLLVNVTPATTVTPGFPAWYYIKVQNMGNTTIGGSLSFNYDAQLNYNSCSIGGVNNTSTHTINFTLSSMMPGATKNIYVDFDAPVTLALGSLINNSATVSVPTTTTDVDLSNNISIINQVAVGSWDPNDKAVSPVGVGSNGSINPTNSNELTYTIRFQNTGTAPAVNVVVDDILDADVDIASFKMLSSSHAYTLQIDETTRKAQWKFSNIMLADSFHNEPQSHGYIQYKIKTIANVTQGNSVENTANIYFDFNAAVVTNTTKNTIDYTLSVADLKAELPSISIAPNPCKNFTTIQITDLKNAADIEVNITNLLGENIQSLQHQNTIINLDASKLTAGIYFYELKNKGVKIGSGKLIVE